MRKIARLTPLAIILIIFTLAYQLKLMSYLNYSALHKYHLALEGWVTSHYWLAILLSSSCYMLIVAAALPVTVVASLLCGFLFGNILGTSVVVFSATVGACCLYLAVKLAFGNYFSHKIGDKVKFMESHFHDNAFYYLLSLRLLPIAPFFLVNIAAGIFAIPFKKFVSATFIGIIPGSFVYVNIGTSLKSLFSRNPNHIGIGGILNPEIISALMLLGLLSLMPVIFKSFKRNTLHDH